MSLKKHTSFRKRLHRRVCCGVVLCLIMFTVATKYYFYDDETYIINWVKTNNLSCHYEMEGDSLLTLDENFSPAPKSIFMHETSCRGGLNSRQACAVESAARAHPNWHVHVLFSGPVSEYVLDRSCLAILLKYTNVKLLRIHLEDYAKNTPVEDLIKSKLYATSNWPVAHISDILRYLTLYKYPGVYMDSDIVMVKPFDKLTSNWAARDSETVVNSGIMSYSGDALGRAIANASIQ